MSRYGWLAGGCVIVAIAACGLPSADEYARGIADAGTDAPVSIADGASDANDVTSDASLPALAIDPPTPDPTQTYDLTALGTLDWEVWTAPVNVCASCARWLGDVTSDGHIGSYNDDARTYRWSNGTPAASGASQLGIFVDQLNTSLTLKVALKSPRAVITLHGDVYFAAGVLYAQLEGDTAAGPSVSVPLGSQNYRFVVHANAPGRVAVLRFQMTGAATGGADTNVAFAAATVTQE